MIFVGVTKYFSEAPVVCIRFTTLYYDSAVNVHDLNKQWRHIAISYVTRWRQFLLLPSHVELARNKQKAFLSVVVKILDSNYLTYVPCSGSSVGSPLTSTLIGQRLSEQQNCDLRLNTNTLIQKVFLRILVEFVMLNRILLHVLHSDLGKPIISKMAARILQFS